jgi:hypothetical protein
MPQDIAVYCATPSDVPEGAYKRFHRDLGAKLGSPVSEMFPSFAAAFPLTVRSMEAHWPKPVAYCKSLMFQTEWLCAMLCIRDDLKLYFDLRSATADFDGPFFDDAHKMHPPRWRELYRWFESFCIGPDPMFKMYWYNTPVHYSSRLNPREFVELKKTTQIGSQNHLEVCRLARQTDQVLDDDRGGRCFVFG